VREAKREYIPNFEAFAHYTYADNVPFVARNYGTFGVHFSYDIFDGGKRRATLQVRDAQAAEAQENLARIRDEVQVRVEAAHNKLEQTEQMLAVSRELLAACEEASRVSAQGLEQGTYLRSQAVALKRVISGVHIVPMGMSNAYPIEDQDELTLIDAGYPGKEAAVLEAIRALGRSPDHLRNLIFTHGHPDHIGSAAAIVRETGAKTHMHPLDIPVAESGGPFRPLTPTPGLLGTVMCKLTYHPDKRVNPVAINQPLTDGETLAIAGGIEVIHAPGHCSGQVAFLWRPGQMLFVGDAGTNFMGIGDPVGFENLEEGRASQRKLANLSFDTVAFGHGKPIVHDAMTCVRNVWAQR